MLFVRTNRCNLRCRWCDSTYTFEGGYEEDLDKIIEEVKSSSEDWICLTGGEPLLQREALEFVARSGQLGKKVLIETGGSLDIAEFTRQDNTVIDMDIKTPSSGEDSSLKLSNLEHLRPSDYIKFVISDQQDYSYFTGFIANNRDSINCGIVVQPAWGTELKWLTEKVLDDRLSVRVLPQMHKLIWGEKRGV